jgi:predicted transcriptional regulator of viral defense system
LFIISQIYILNKYVKYIYLINYLKIRKLKGKLFFTINDVSGIYNISQQSAWVLCSRYVKSGIFIRLKNNLYVLGMNWDNFSVDNFFRISNYIQVPSYVSFLTALSYYGISTQVQRNVFECVSLKRSKAIDIRDTTFAYYKLREKLYTGFVKEKNYFIAVPEKAFADAVYLSSLGRYSLDVSSLDTRKLNKKKLSGILKIFPKKTQNVGKEICKI